MESQTANDPLKFDTLANYLRSCEDREGSKDSWLRRGGTFEDVMHASNPVTRFFSLFFLSFIFIFYAKRSLDRGAYVDRVTRCIHLALLGHVSMGTYVVVVPRNTHTTGDREHAQTPFIPTASLHRNTNALRPRLFY